MDQKTKKILMFIAAVIIVALLIKVVFSILSSLGWFVMLVAAAIVYWQWPKIKKMF
jgi:hypothetical protein